MACIARDEAKVKLSNRVVRVRTFGLAADRITKVQTAAKLLQNSESQLAVWGGEQLQETTAK